MMPVTLWSNNAMPNGILDDLKVDEQIGHLSGGSGGVHVFKATDGKRYTLKTSSSSVALKDEIFADAVYQRLGFNVPAFSFYQGSYNELPLAIKTCIPKPKDETEIVLFRLAEYIEPNNTLSEEERRLIIKSQLPEGFTTDCLMANTDIAGHWQNVLIDNHNKVWRIDNGSTLRFRARGEMKPLRTIVSELTSMKNETEMMKEVFGDISPQAVQHQTQLLLSKRHNLIDLFYEMHDQISFDQPEMLLKILVNRLQYLHEHVSPLLHTYAPAYSETCLDYSGAGIFLFAEVDGKIQVLLGKRRGHEWWGSFGGASDKSDLFLKDTAARESNEELINIYKVSANELDDSPSHDLVLEQRTALNVPKFRMYFVKRDAISSTEFNKKIESDKQQGKADDHEHDEFTWIPIDAILSAKEVEKHDQKYGSHKTLSLNLKEADNSERQLLLHPPLAMMLQQAPVQAQLKSLVEKKALTNGHHTRTRISDSYPSQITNDATKADEITPMAERYQLAKVSARRGLMQRELTKRTKESQPSTNSHQSKTEIKTQSDIHFQALMGNDFIKHKEQKSKVEAFEKNYKKLHVSMNNIESQQFVKMLEEEGKHPHQYVFYHATQSEIGFLYDIFTEFRRQLEHQYAEDFEVLRGLDDLFAQFKDVIEFMDAYSMQGKVEIDNYAQHYQEMGLSVNPFLFGSDGDSSSASYAYFIQSRSLLPPDIEKLFKYFAARLQTDIDFSHFQTIFKQFKLKAGGVCYQIFVDEACIDHVAYPAKRGGPLNPLQTDEGEIKIYSKVFAELRKHPDKYSAYIQGLQTRLYLKPEIFHDPAKVQIKTYQANPFTNIEKEDYQKALSQAVTDCIVPILANYKKLPANDFARALGKPSLHNQMGMVYQQTRRLPVSEMTDLREIIPELLLHRNVASLVNIIVNTKNLDLMQSLITRDYGPSNNALKLLDVFAKYPDITTQVFEELQKYKGEAHIDKIINELHPIAWNHYISNGNLEQVQALFKATANKESERYIHNALKLAIFNDRPIVFSWLLKKYHEFNYKLFNTHDESLRLAVNRGSAKIVEQILSTPEAVNITNEQYAYMLVLASTNNSLDIIDMILTKLQTNPTRVKSILGLAITWQLSYQEPPLFHLVAKGQHELLEKSFQGFSSQEKANLIRNFKDQYGDNLLTIAVKNNHANTVRTLLNLCQNPATKTDLVMTKYIGGLITRQSTKKTNPMLIATANNNVEIVKLLIPHITQFNGRDETGKTALMVAAEKGYTEIVNVLINHPTINESGLYFRSVTHVDQFDALSLASRNGHIDIVSILLQKLDTWNFNTALKQADAFKQTEILNLINCYACPLKNVLEMASIAVNMNVDELIRKRIKTVLDFRDALRTDKESHRDKIYESLKDTLPAMIRYSRNYALSLEGLAQAFEYLTTAQCGEICRQIIKTKDDLQILKDALKKIPIKNSDHKIEVKKKIEEAKKAKFYNFCQDIKAKNKESNSDNALTNKIGLWSATGSKHQISLERKFTSQIKQLDNYMASANKAIQRNSSNTEQLALYKLAQFLRVAIKEFTVTMNYDVYSAHIKAITNQFETDHKPFLAKDDQSQLSRIIKETNEIVKAIKLEQETTSPAKRIDSV